MFENLSGKQGFLFGILSGMGLTAIIGFSFLTPVLLRNNTVAQNVGGTYQQVAQTTPQDTATVPSAPIPTNIPKTKKPKVELFVMSKCPYGLQMEKAFVPAYDLLKKKADFDIKFVSYAMHGKEEVDENTRQYCAQQQDKDKFYKYLDCYSAEGDTAGCMKLSGLNESKINSCVDKANKEFGILDKFNDQSTWLSGRYPIYPIDEELNTKYGVQGSPTLVINGVQVDAGRTPDAIKSVVCAAFENAPSECEQALSASSPQPGFGTGLAQNVDSGAACGG